jgi:hypothetical protein
MIINNIGQVKRAITSQTHKIDEGARLARDEMMTTFIQLAQEEIKGQRAKIGSKWEKATPDEPPKNRTGNLRRSIRGEKAREGFATYTAVVGPTIIYGRSVEVGGQYAPPTWRHNEKFPYMRPAFDKFQRVVGSIIRKHLA